MLLWGQTTEQEPVISPGFIIEEKIEGLGYGRIARCFMVDVR
jgi:hypothetical protein